MYKTGCVFEGTIPGQGIVEDHRPSAAIEPPHLEMYYLDGQANWDNFQVLCSGLKCQSCLSESRCFCRWDTKKIRLSDIGKKRRGFAVT